MGMRRMISKRIISSAKFLQMPLEAQALYFHLTVNADDDGVAEAYPITKLLGTPPDVIKILLAKEFIRQLNEDQVVLINNWTEHNIIRADRKVNSIYKNLLPEDIKLIEAKPRSDVKDNSKRVGGLSTDGISKDKLSQVKLSEVRENTPAETFKKFLNSSNQDRVTLLEEKIKRNLTADEKNEIENFASYWMELNGNGTKQRWEFEKTFDLVRRIKTWFSNIYKYNKKSYGNKQQSSKYSGIAKKAA